MFSLRAGQSFIKEQGEIILLKFADAIMEAGKIKQMPRLEGKRMIMIVAPKKNKTSYSIIIKISINAKNENKIRSQKKIYFYWYR